MISVTELMEVLDNSGVSMSFLLLAGGGLVIALLVCMVKAICKCPGFGDMLYRFGEMMKGNKA